MSAMMAASALMTKRLDHVINGSPVLWESQRPQLRIKEVQTGTQSPPNIGQFAFPAVIVKYD